MLKTKNSWINSIKNGNEVDPIYTDFEKVFYKVPNKKLLFKQKNMV